MCEIKNLYVLHNLDTINGINRKASLHKYFDSFEDAIKTAKKNLGKYNFTSGIVIFKAIAVARPKNSPVEVIDLETGEEI